METNTRRELHAAHANGEHANSREIEQNIERIRHEMDETLEEIGQRLHPKHLVEVVLDLFRGSGEHGQGREYTRQAKTMGRQVVRKIKQHPVPTLLCAAGAAWMLFEELSADYDDEPPHAGRARGLREQAGSVVDARTGEPYDDSYGQEWRGVAAWSTDYDWSKAGHDEPTWSERARQALEDLRAKIGDSTVSAGQRLRTAASTIVGLSGRKRAQIHAQWANLRENSGSVVDARTGQPYSESYGSECQDLCACDFAASREWTAEEEQTWTEKAQQALEGIQATLSGTGHDVKDRTRAVASKIGEFVSSTGGIASDYGSAARHTTARAAAATREGTARIGRRIKGGYDLSRDTLGRAVEDYPLAVGAACLGLGLIFGLAIPMTRQEDQLMGEAADRAKEQLREMGQQALERGQRVAKAATEAASEELEDSSAT
jgi:hypothetical protein